MNLPVWWTYVDQSFTLRMERYPFTASFVQNPISKYISEALCLTFVLIVSYETLYWSGIKLGLWTWHAKDIFPDVPVHCAHVYVRINLAEAKKADDVREYYRLKRESPLKILQWTSLHLLRDVFELENFVTYHFEFSPEDFEHNPEPEWGSTVAHLREKTLNTFLASPIHTKHYSGKQDLLPENVLVFNNKCREVTHAEDKAYLSKTSIETGNYIDCVVLV